MMSGRPLIFLLAYADPLLGMERSAVRLAERLAQKVPVELVVLSGEPPKLGSVVTRSLYGENGPSLAGLFRLWRYAREADGIVVSVGAWISIPWLLVCGRFRKRTVIWEHSLVRERLRSSVRPRILRMLAAALYPTADSVVVVSDALYADLEEMCPGQEIVCIPNLLVDADHVARRPEIVRRSARGARTRLVSVGSLTKNKRQAMIIRALSELDVRFTLDVVGDGPERDRLEALAADTGVSERVTFHGYVPASEVRSILSRSDILVHAAEGETFGLVYFEAAEFQLPVLTASHRVSEAVIPHYVLGRTFQSYVELLSTLKNGVFDSVSYADFEVTRRFREERFGSDAIVAKWMTFLSGRFDERC